MRWVLAQVLEERGFKFVPEHESGWRHGLRSSIDNQKFRIRFPIQIVFSLEILHLYQLVARKHRRKPQELSVNPEYHYNNNMARHNFIFRFIENNKKVIMMKIKKESGIG